MSLIRFGLNLCSLAQYIRRHPYKMFFVFCTSPYYSVPYERAVLIKEISVLTRFPIREMFVLERFSYQLPGPCMSISERCS